MKRPALLACAAIGCVLSLALNASAQRIVLPLDGQWRVEPGKDPAALPQAFTHVAPVPGMANLAQPRIPHIDEFDSQEVIANRVRKKTLPESARVQTPGISRQDQDYLWYRKEFKAPAKKAVAILRINKAQFGTAVWLNGIKAGEYAGCFTASYFNVTDAVRWNGDNQLVVRIGAHPGVLPVTYPAGTDFEKLKWTPGIYDSVSVSFCDNPVIETVQVAPRVAGPDPEIVVQTRIKNYGPACSATLTHKVRPWKGSKTVATAEPESVQLGAGEEKILTRTIKVPGGKLWSPEHPFLYAVETATGGDNVITRFGLREFRADAKTGRFYLNGKVYYLRGSNITLHRFFEDPNCGDLPWNEKWLQKMLVEIPKKMNWNSFRLCIGPVPERWLEIADEQGLLFQNEFFIWTGAPSWDRNYARHWDADEMIRQYRDWMRDGWNHPSVAIWDANNETEDPVFGEKIIPAVRGLDLSQRPWENSYNRPAGPDDPIEFHPYLYHSTASGTEIKFRLSDLEKMDGKPSAWHFPKEPHPVLINEYGWLWLNRDGSPTLLTDTLYPRLLGTNATAADRFAFDAYALAAKTEFWRARRKCAGILHFVYLTCSYPGVYTSDHFLDVKRLKLEPHFADYVGEAFKPLGVYVNFFQPSIKQGEQRNFPVTLINDEDARLQGSLELSLETESGRVLGKTSRPFEIAGLGDTSFEVPFTVPNGGGKCILKASAKAKGHAGRTICRRWVRLE